MSLKKLKAKFKSWIFETFLKRYLVTIDEKFVELFINKIEKKKVQTPKSQQQIRYENIVNELKSEKYRDYFYRVVRYEWKVAENKVVAYGDSWKDKIYLFIAKLYIYLFKWELDKNIKLYLKFKNKTATIDKKADAFIANTTLDERADKAVENGVISNNTATAQKRVRKIKSTNVAKIKKSNEAIFPEDNSVGLS